MNIKGEWEQGVLKSASLISLSDIIDNPESKLKKKEEKIYLHCKAGSRSKLVYSYLKHKGFNVIDVTSGFDGLIENKHFSLQIIKPNFN